MKMIFMCRGLPGSGKSTKTKELLTDPDLQPIQAVNKDSIRESMGIEPGNFKREKFVQQEESRQITEILEAGISLIVDNTHNSPKYMAQYQQMAKAYGYDFELIDLSDVPVEECIRRDALRTGREHVGEDVILRMYNDFYNKTGEKKVITKTQQTKKGKLEPCPFPQPEPMKQDPRLPKCVIVDLDGTLAKATDRSWYAYSACESDEVIQHIHTIVAALLKAQAVDHVLFVTGREDSGRAATERWLRNKAEFDVDSQTFHLFMRATGDHRPDTETKRELFERYIRDKYYVLAIFEDRPRVIRMWVELGLPVLAVGESLSRLPND